MYDESKEAKYFKEIISRDNVKYFKEVKNLKSVQKAWVYLEPIYDGAFVGIYLMVYYFCICVQLGYSPPKILKHSIWS